MAKKKIKENVIASEIVGACEIRTVKEHYSYYEEETGNRISGDRDAIKVYHKRTGHFAFQAGSLKSARNLCSQPNLFKD